MINLKEVLKSKENLKNAIPYRNILNLAPSPLDRCIVQNENNSIFLVWQLWGTDSHNSDSILVERSKKIAEMLSSNFDSRYEFVFDFNRVITDFIYQKPEIEENLNNAKTFFDLRLSHFDKDLLLFENVIYFSICYLPKNPVTGRVSAILTTEEIESFGSAVDFCESFFQYCGFDFKKLKDSELVSYLYKTVSNNFDKDFHLNEPDGDLNVAFASVTDIWQTTFPLKINDNLTLCLPLTYFPSKKTWHTTFTNMFESFSKTSFPLRYVIKYQCNDRKESEDKIYKRKKTLLSHKFRISLTSAVSSGLKNQNFSEDEVDLSILQGVDGCNNALFHINEDNLSCGNLCLTVLLSVPQSLEKHLYSFCKEISNILSDLGIKTYENNAVKIANTCMFYATFIGTCFSFKDNVRLALADNVASCFLIGPTNYHYYSPFLEKITGSNLPHLIGTRTDKSLFKASLCGSSEIGHTFLAGATGSGKSVTLSYMLNAWLQYKNTKAVVLDMGLSCLKSVLGNNGKLYYPGVDNTSFCPFRMAKDRVLSVLNFIEAIALGNGFSLQPKERKDIAEVIRIMPYKKEDFEVFYALYRGVSGETQLTQALLQYLHLYKNYFDAKSDTFTNMPRVVGIELSKLLTNQSNALVYPSLVYILDSLEQNFVPEHPTLLILDEAWAYLRNTFFSSYIEKWLKQLRKKNVFVVLATQQLKDLLDSPLRETVIENCHTQIYMASEKAESPVFFETYKALGLDLNSISLIAKLPKFSMLFVQEGFSIPFSWDFGNEIDCLTRDRKKEKELEK